MQANVAARAASQVADSALLGDQPGLTDLAEENTADPNGESTATARDQHARDAEAILAQTVRVMRRFIVSCDTDEMPFTRVVGRVAYILTVEGGKEACTVAPIAVAFLLYLRQHLEVTHRQTIINRQAIDATESNLQGLLYDRLKKLCSRPWCALEKATGARGFRLTDDGRFVFNGWPEGIEFDARNPDVWARKRPANRGS